ncbi:hypothetical protein [Vibrio harveyi]|uniref:hypothetical protein n=1 Tax=Vibrio harveyi TaxID=669 RepID=UPI003CF67390
MKKIILLVALVFSSYGFGRVPEGALPEQNITINIKYDKNERRFFDVSATGSQYLDFDVRDDGFVLTHGRDGLIGVRTEVNQQGIAAFVMNRGENRAQLTNTSNGSVVPFQVGLVSSSIRILMENKFFGSATSSNCNRQNFQEYSTTNVKFILQDPFSASSCRTESFYSSNYNFGDNVINIGLIERFFRFDMKALDELEFGVYEGIFSDNSSSFIRLDYLDGRQYNVGEVYNFRIRLEMMPSINSFSVDNDNLAFLVTRQRNEIVGKAQTGFNVRGSFYNSQSFSLSFTSLNSAMCQGALCMINGDTGMVLPYTVGVLDPVTLQDKLVTRSGQQITVDADKKFQLFSRLFFEFESFDTALSGTFNDTITLRVEMKLE